MVARAARKLRPPEQVPTAEELQERWGRWLEQLYFDVVTPQSYRRRWGLLAEAGYNNEEIPRPNHVMDFLLELYSIVIAVGVGRQDDRSNDVASLARLIEDIGRHPEAVTRDWFVGRYQTFMEETAHADFDMFAGPDQPHVDADGIRADL
jgi:hypothetical protein